MRSRIFVTAAALLLLAGCHAAGGALGGGSGRVTLPDTFEARTAIEYGTRRYEGNFTRTLAGDVRFEVLSPESMAGMRLAIEDGEMKAALGELSFTVDSGAPPEGAVLGLLRDALSQVGGVTFKTPGGDGPFQMTLDADGNKALFVVEKDGDHFVPRSVAVESLGFKATFERGVRE